MSNTKSIQWQFWSFLVSCFVRAPAPSLQPLTGPLCIFYGFWFYVLMGIICVQMFACLSLYVCFWAFSQALLFSFVLCYPNQFVFILLFLDACLCGFGLEGWGIWEELGEGNYNQNALYEKIIFNKRKRQPSWKNISHLQRTAFGIASTPVVRGPREDQAAHLCICGGGLGLVCVCSLVVVQTLRAPRIQVSGLCWSFRGVPISFSFLPAPLLLFPHESPQAPSTVAVGSLSVSQLLVPLRGNTALFFGLGCSSHPVFFVLPHEFKGAFSISVIKNTGIFIGMIF